MLADSEAVRAEMGNHTDRPELKEAPEGRTGVSIRRSPTLGSTHLGLAIVKHIAQAHDGRVSVDSRVG